jgi:hypothetical protein
MFSLMTILLLFSYLFLPKKIWKQNFAFLMIILAISTLVLYPLSLLNRTELYPYAWGYNAVVLPSVYLLIAVAAVWKDKAYTYASAMILMCVIFYAFKWPLSDNFWDYMLDPFIGLYAVFALPHFTAHIKIHREKMPITKKSQPNAIAPVPPKAP